MTDSVRLKLTLRPTASASELLVTATVSTSVKLPPSQLHVERQAPMSPVFHLTMKGSKLYSAKDAVIRLLRMYQDPASSLYSSSTSKAIFAGSEIEVLKYLGPPTPAHVADSPLPQPAVAKYPDYDGFTFRGPPPARPAPEVVAASIPALAKRQVALAICSSPILSVRPATRTLSVEHMNKVIFPFRRRPSLNTWFSDKVTVKALPPPPLPTPPAQRSVRERASLVAPPAVPLMKQASFVPEPVVEDRQVVRRSSASIRMKSPVQAVLSDEEEDLFPKSSMRAKVSIRENPSVRRASRQISMDQDSGNFSVLSEATKREEERSDISSERNTKTMSLRRQAGSEEEEEEAAPLSAEESEAESSGGWSWLWGGGDSDKEAEKKRPAERKRK